MVVGLLPGWRAELVPVPRETILGEARRVADFEVFGVSRPGKAGDTWHAQYIARPLATRLHNVGVEARLPAFCAPDFVAHIPRGAVRSDATYRVVTEVHWPWWRPGGGIDWDVQAN